MSRLLYASKFKKSCIVSELSATMKLYLAVNVFCGATTLPYLFYKVLWWRPPCIRGAEPVYSATLFHFISGIFYALHYAVSSILVFILCLDRCLLIKTGITHWDGKNRRMFFKAGVFVLLLVYFGVGGCYYFEFPLNYNIREFFIIK
uniref:7TM_GPCR_Srx domain-containing protein n=1 Tax=Meloidogyne hapla TaxID=6305 RepID=A0A1I8BM08_MELHA